MSLTELENPLLLYRKGVAREQRIMYNQIYTSEVTPDPLYQDSSPFLIYIIKLSLLYQVDFHHLRGSITHMAIFSPYKSWSTHDQKWPAFLDQVTTDNLYYFAMYSQTSIKFLFMLKEKQVSTQVMSYSLLYFTPCGFKLLSNSCLGMDLQPNYFWDIPTFLLILSCHNLT